MRQVVFFQASIIGVLVSFSILSMDDIGLEQVQEIKPGLYVASRNVNGDRLYFGLQENVNNSIEAFRNYVSNIAGPNPRNLVQVFGNIFRSARGLEPFEFDQARKLFDDDPLTNQKLIDYVLGTDKQNLKWGHHLSKITYGSNHASRPGQDMFAWISTQPITHYRDFGYLSEIRNHPEPFDVIAASQSNQDLVILISASTDSMDEIPGKPGYILGGYGVVHASSYKIHIHVVGIFKPPHEILYGHHGNISPMFNGFIAHQARTKLGKDVYYIKDLADKMHEILLNPFNGGHYKGITLRLSDLYGDIDGKTPWTERQSNFAARTSALERLFTES